jgi:hypothetical protein
MVAQGDCVAAVLWHIQAGRNAVSPCAHANLAYPGRRQVPGPFLADFLAELKGDSGRDNCLPRKGRETLMIRFNQAIFLEGFLKMILICAVKRHFRLAFTSELRLKVTFRVMLGTPSPAARRAFEAQGTSKAITR